MYISQLRIRNFRNFRSARFVLQKGVNTFIGENGAGKTNAFFALRLLLDESLTRSAAYLKPRDFCRSLKRWQGHWVMIAVDFEDLDPSEGCQILKHATGHMNGSESGTYLFTYRPRQKVRKRLFDMTQVESSRAEFKAYLQGLTTDDYEAVHSGRANADFLNDDEYAAIAGDFESFAFPDPDEDDQESLGVRTTNPIHAEITCTFVQALRDAVSDLRGYRNNPLLALLQGTEASIGSDDAKRITEAVADLNSDIASLSEIREIAIGIQSTLHKTVGHTFSPSVSIESMLPDQLDKLLQRLAVTVGDDIEVDYRGDLSELSLGGANLIYLALKLLEYELKLSSDRVAHFLLIEEPEAHIHAHVQKTLFGSQSADRTQVILSTHSTHISSAAAIGAMNVLARQGTEAAVFQPAHGLEPQTISRVERYLDATRSTLLFAKGVVLIEGDAELVLIPTLIKAVFGVSVDELGVSVVAMNSAFFEHVAVIFDDQRIRRRCAIVTDLDASLISIPDDPADDSPVQARARASQEEGERRKETLDTFAADNVWVWPFYAEHTFEVDFIGENNSREVLGTLDSIFTQVAARKRSEERIKSSDIVAAGSEILRLAKKVGKGWFALLLSEHLEVDTVIPEYIIRAVAFAASDNVTDSILRKMGLYRMNQELFDEEIRESIQGAGDVKEMSESDLINAFKEYAPDDPLTALANYLSE